MICSSELSSFDSSVFGGGTVGRPSSDRFFKGSGGGTGDLARKGGDSPGKLCSFSGLPTGV